MKIKTIEYKQKDKTIYVFVANPNFIGKLVRIGDISRNDEELSTSFARQVDILSSGGFVFHLVWQQLEAPKEDFGLNYIKRDLTAMKKAMGNSFEIIETKEFGEFENGDSLAILARKI